MFIDAHQVSSRIQVTFVDHQIHRHSLISRDGRHPIDEEGLRHRVDVGGKYHQGIHVGNRRTDEGIFPGKNLLHHALALLHGDFHQIPGQGRIAPTAKDPSGPAGNEAGVRLHVIEAADGAQNPPLQCLGHFVNSNVLVSRNWPFRYRS